MTLHSSHACAIAGATLSCWGSNAHGGLGIDTGPGSAGQGNASPALLPTEPRGVPEQPVDPGGPVHPGAPGGPASTAKQRTTVALAKIKRDRRPPYVYVVKGRLRGPSRCTGRIVVVTRYKKRRLARKQVRLKPNCSYRTKVKVTQRRLTKALPRRLRGTRTPVRLVVVARWKGSATLAASRTKRSTRAR